MLIGYARVSTDGQDTATQVKALKAAGVEKIFQEKASGGRWDRLQLHRLFEQLREGDVVLVWKLDRLSRSLKDLLHVIEKNRFSRSRLQKPDRSNRHHYSRRTNDDANDRSLCRV